MSYSPFDRQITFDDVLLIPQYNDISSRKDVDISVCSHSMPFVSSNMDSITGFEMAKYLGSIGAFSFLHRFMKPEDNAEIVEKLIEQNISSSNLAVSVGVSDSEFKRAQLCSIVGATHFCVDIAHGHSSYVADMIKRIKDSVENSVVIAGNVCTGEGVRFLEEAGADIVKVGIGAGGACTTRIQTGHGWPQLSAIYNCSEAAESALIIADGGIKSPGDAAKAIAFGADYVMLGSALAATDCTPYYDEQEHYNKEINREKYCISFRGMASKEANEDFFGEMAEWKTAEGISALIPYRGPTKNVIKRYCGGLRSALTYSGCRNIKEFKNKARFALVSQNSVRENSAHVIMKE